MIKILYILIVSCILYVSKCCDWVDCAEENSYCSFKGIHRVRYGNYGSWTEQDFYNGVECNNSVFGDPLYGKPKKCSYWSC